MKISELTTDEACSVLCTITSPIENIVTDRKVIDEMGRKIKASDIQTKGQQYLVGINKITSLIPLLLMDHREDVFEIVAALNDTEVEVVSKQNILKTAAMLRDALKDKDLIDFFKSCVNTEAGG